jgi:hypothetical protein
MTFVTFTLPGKVRGEALGDYRSGIPGIVGLGQLNQIIVGTLFLFRTVEGEHNPPVGELVCGAGVGAAELSDELPSRRVHPPALQEGEEDDHGYGDEDPEDDDGEGQAH